MSTARLHSNQSSNSFNFVNDTANVPPPSLDSPCSVYVDTDDFWLGPYDLHECRTKMSGGASPSSALPKKKKKNDAKGQSQLNKCLNEKRRREQENIYIEELAELISASFADMSSLSVKPDKCAILQETVKQVRAGTHSISTDQTECGLISTEAAVQQGEISSSKPTRISNTELAPLLLSALDGFLFVVNQDGQIEFVTENIQQFLHYNKDELLGKSVYNIIHHGDHTRFGALLNNPLLIYPPIVSPGSNRPTTPLMEQSPSGSRGNSWNQRFSSKFNCRLLIKPPSDQDQTIEEKQTRVCQYETLQISSTKINGGMVDEEENCTEGTSAQNLLCIARRIPFNEKHLSPPLEQFTIKLDQNGKILALDTKDVSDMYARHINNECLVGRLLHDKCHKNDIHKVASHLQETRQAGYDTSPVYKLHLVDDRFVNVQTKSKYFKSSDGHEIDFIMAAHSIIGDNEMCAMIENNTALQTSNTSLNGTDLLQLNGDGPNRTVSTLQSESKFSNSNYNMTPSTDLSFSDFGIFPSTTFGDVQENKWSESCTNSIEAPSKTTPVSSPATVSNPHTPTTQIYTPFPFSPLVQSPKDSFDLNSNADRVESARLRTLLLTTKRNDGMSDEINISKNKHNNILKGLLNPDELTTHNIDDESSNHNTPLSPSVKTPLNNSVLNDTPSTMKNSTSNNMLLQLLNDKHEDEDMCKSQSELLQQLLKEENVRPIAEQNDLHSNENIILSNTGFRLVPPKSPDNHGGRKRNSISSDIENDRPPLKRTNSSAECIGPSIILDSLSNPSGSQSLVTNSKLREKNKMLASLLAKDAPPTSIPVIPASIITATPQDKLVTIIKQQQGSGNWNCGQHSINSTQNTQLPSHQRILLQKNQSSGIQTQNQIQQMRQVTSSGSTSYSNSQLNNMAETNSSSSSLPFSSDPELSELLEEVMDIMNVSTDNSTLLNLFNVLETANTSNTPIGSSSINQNSFNSLMNEKMAVNAIQKSLMQVESTVTSPINYNPSTGNNIHSQNQFISPPAYQQKNNCVRFNPQQSPRLPGVVQQYPKNIQTPPLQQTQLLQLQQKQRLIQQQKQRLLQQQLQQQIMVVTSNAPPNSTSNLQTIDSLLNNTGPPNVALQRSSNVPDSQLSPVYASTNSQMLNTSQISMSPNRQPSYSVSQQFPMLSYGTSQNSQTTQSQPSTSKISPLMHSPYHNPINPCVNQQQQPSQNIYIDQNQQSGVWMPQRLTLHQQQNPMLNAQLQVTGSVNSNSVRQNFINQSNPIGVLNTAAYSSDIPPSNNCPPQQVQQQFRLSRNINMTTANSQIPGTNIGVTEYTRNELRAYIGVRSQQGNSRSSGQLLISGQNVMPLEHDTLGLNFDLSPTSDNKSPNWSGSDLGSSQPQGLPGRSSIEEPSNGTSNIGTDQKSSLLQKLLSE